MRWWLQRSCVAEVVDLAINLSFAGFRKRARWVAEVVDLAINLSLGAVVKGSEKGS